MCWCECLLVFVGVTQAVQMDQGGYVDTHLWKLYKAWPRVPRSIAKSSFGSMVQSCCVRSSVHHQDMAGALQEAVPAARLSCTRSRRVLRGGWRWRLLQRTAAAVRPKRRQSRQRMTTRCRPVAARMRSPCTRTRCPPLTVRPCRRASAATVCGHAMADCRADVQQRARPQCMGLALWQSRKDYNQLVAQQAFSSAPVSLLWLEQASGKHIIVRAAALCRRCAAAAGVGDDGSCLERPEAGNGAAHGDAADSKAAGANCTLRRHRCCQVPQHAIVTGRSFTYLHLQVSIRLSFNPTFQFVSRRS